MNSERENITLSFLISGAHKCVPSSYLKLRSYLYVHSSTIAGHIGLKLPKSLTSKNITCPFCYTPWSQNTASFKLFPSPRKTKNGLRNAESNMKESMSSRNKLVLKCKLCTKKSSFLLIKKKNFEESVIQLPTENCQEKKKKKKKNKQSNLCLKVQCDKKKKAQILSSSKKAEKSLECSVTSTGTVCKKVPTQNLKMQKNMLKSQINLNSAATENNQANMKNDKKQLVLNPYALVNKSITTKKNRKQFERLKKAMSHETTTKTTTKKTFQDFLTLVNR